MEQDININDAQVEKLYAGKFKTVEELEKGYSSGAKVFQENSDLKKQLEEVTLVPDDYMTPSDVNIAPEDIDEFKKLAKSTKLNQHQYDSLLREAQAKAHQNAEYIENQKKEIGADKLNLLQEFVKNNYGDGIGDSLLKNAITDRGLRELLLAKRAEFLASNVPGMSRAAGTTQYSVTKKDVLNAREEMIKSSGKARVEAQNRYINLQSQYANRDKE